MSHAGNSVDRVTIELSVVAGQTMIPIRQLLRIGRGAIIMLDVKPDDPCRIYAGDQLIGRGEILAVGDKLGVSITETD